jgi:chemotaxis signal transduction protein
MEFLRGLGEVENGFILVLDIDRILTNEELLVSYPEALAAADAEPVPAS